MCVCYSTYTYIHTKQFFKIGQNIQKTHRLDEMKDNNDTNH